MAAPKVEDTSMDGDGKTRGSLLPMGRRFEGTSKRLATDSRITVVPEFFPKPFRYKPVQYKELHILPRQERLHTGVSNRWRSENEFIGDMLDGGQQYHSMIGYYKRFQQFSEQSRFAPKNGIIPKKQRFSHDCQCIDLKLLEKMHPTYDKPMLMPKRGGSRKLQLLRRTIKYNNLFRLSPEAVFKFLKKTGGVNCIEPDVNLCCMNMKWQLHRSVLQKSRVLGELLEQAEVKALEDSQYVPNDCDSLEEYFSKQMNSEAPPPPELIRLTKDRRPIYEIELEISDQHITKHSLAITLGNLYHLRAQLEGEDLVPILATAAYIGFNGLLQVVTQLYSSKMDKDNVLLYYAVAKKYNLEVIKHGVVRWLEINLIPTMFGSTHLRRIPVELMIMTISSQRLFIFTEYSVWKLLCTWIFLRLRDDVQGVPPFDIVVEYFKKQAKNRSFLQKPIGEPYTKLFNEVRLHGITNHGHIKTIQHMNIFSLDKAFKVMMEHRTTVCTGGTMAVESNFGNLPIRRGFVVREYPHHFMEMYSFSGFHFELRASVTETPGRFYFQINRLRSLDVTQNMPAELTVHDRRCIQYGVQVQHMDKNGLAHTYISPVMEKMFSIEPPGSLGEIFLIENVDTPLYVTYLFYIP